MRWIASEDQHREDEIHSRTGPVMTQAEFKAEREIMETVRIAVVKQVRSGGRSQGYVGGGVLQRAPPGPGRNPYKFLYAAAKGLWGNHNKLDSGCCLSFKF
jgi:hypothetical protein